MDVLKSQTIFSCLTDLSEHGDDFLHFNNVGRAEKYFSNQVISFPTCHTGHCSFSTRDSASLQSLADIQECKTTELGRCLTMNYPEKVTSDDDLEYFECSDVLTVHEDEIWKKKLEFLLENDDEDDLKLSEDCDGCAYFLSETPRASRVSGNTTPVGLWEHQSKIKGPFMYNQSDLQPEMTLTVGHHRDKSTILKDKEKNETPSASGNEESKNEEAIHGSVHLAASSSRDESNPTDDEILGTMTQTKLDVLGENSLLLEEGRRNVPEKNTQHAVCSLTKNLRRNFFKLLNPLELCRYVSTIGQSFQAATEESRNLESLCSTQTESWKNQAGVCPTEEADTDNQRKRIQGLSEQNQIPDENITFESQSADLKSVTQNCMKARTEKENIFMACESAGINQLTAENVLQIKNSDLQTSHPHCAPFEKRDSNGKKSENDFSSSPLRDTDCAPDKQERLCAVLSSAKLCDEPGEGEQRANPKSLLESGEAECKGDADISAVHDKLWKLLHEDDSDYEIPFENGGVPSLGPALTDIKIPKFNFMWETCSDQPLLLEQESMRESAHNPRNEKADWKVSDVFLQRAAASAGNVGLADGVCLDSDTGNEMEIPSICVSANTTQECLEQNAMVMDRNGCTVIGEEKGNHSGMSASNSDSHHLAQNNTNQVTEIANQEGGKFLRDFYLEDFYQPGGEQREVCIPEEHRAETSCDSGFSQASEIQISPYNPTEQHSFFVDRTFEFKIDSSKNPTYAAGSVTSTLKFREAQGERHSAADEENGSSQQLLGNKTLPFLTPVSHSEGLSSECAVACPDTRNEGKIGSVQSGVKVKKNLTPLEKPCKSWQDLLQRVPGETKGESTLLENEHEIPKTIDEAEPKPPLHTWTGPQALKQIMNISTDQSCPDLIPSSETTEAENLIQPTKCDGKEEVRTAESVRNDLINFSSVGSGNNQCSQEQPSHRKSPSFSLTRTTLDPFPVNTENKKNQEGSKSCQAEPIKWKEDTTKSGTVAAGAKKKLPAVTVSKKPRLEEKGSVSKDLSCVKKSGKSEGGVIHKEDRKEQRKFILKKDSKAPRLLKKIQAELFPDCSASIKLCCQFGDIHSDSTITWTKDCKILAQLQRSAQDDSPVSLVINEATSQDQGMYYCCLNNVYGKVTAEFHLTAAVLERLSSFQSYEGVEEIEFMQLMFREDPLSSSYFGGTLHGAIMTEGMHFGEGMHRKAFRSRVLQGLAPAFAAGHPCVLKVHNTLNYSTKNQDELLQKNYNLALQECQVQNTAREYAKLYAAEAEPLEGFGEVPEIIPIFLIHRPANNIPYATVEEELVGEFVKYSVKDGKEVNFLRRDTEAGQKCCTFQHWVYEKTNGNLLVTDLQGVGMKLTDVGIATLAKGYKGFKGNCSFSFIEQFRALHQCNEYCEMLGLKSLRSTHQKLRKASSTKSKNLPNSSTVKKILPKKTKEPRDFISSEH